MGISKKTLSDFLDSCDAKKTLWQVMFITESTSMFIFRDWLDAQLEGELHSLTVGMHEVKRGLNQSGRDQNYEEYITFALLYCLLIKGDEFASKIEACTKVFEILREHELISLPEIKIINWMAKYSINIPELLEALQYLSTNNALNDENSASVFAFIRSNAASSREKVSGALELAEELVAIQKAEHAKTIKGTTAAASGGAGSSVVSAAAEDVGNELKLCLFATKSFPAEITQCLGILSAATPSLFTTENIQKLRIYANAVFQINIAFIRLTDKIEDGLARCITQDDLDCIFEFLEEKYRKDSKDDSKLGEGVFEIAESLVIAKAAGITIDTGVSLNVARQMPRVLAELKKLGMLTQRHANVMNYELNLMDYEWRLWLPELVTSQIIAKIAGFMLAGEFSSERATREFPKVMTMLINLGMLEYRTDPMARAVNNFYQKKGRKERVEVLMLLEDSGLLVQNDNVKRLFPYWFDITTRFDAKSTHPSLVSILEILRHLHKIKLLNQKTLDALITIICANEARKEEILKKIAGSFATLTTLTLTNEQKSHLYKEEVVLNIIRGGIIAEGICRGYVDGVRISTGDGAAATAAPHPLVMEVVAVIDADGVRASAGGGAAATAAALTDASAATLFAPGVAGVPRGLDPATLERSAPLYGRPC